MSEQAIAVVPSAVDGAGTEGAARPATSSFSEAFTWSELSLGLAISMPVLYAALAVIEASSYLWRPLALLLYAALLVLALGLTLGSLLSGHKEGDRRDAETNTALTLFCGIAVLVCFSQASKHLYLLVGGFSATGSGYWHWMRFGCANLLEAILFDIPDIYAWNVSEVRPTAFWSRTVLFLFRTSLEFMVVVALLREAAAIRELWSIPAEKSACGSYVHHLLRRTGSLALTAVWALPLVVGIAAIRNDGFSAEVSRQFARLSLPVALGVWLAWQSLAALRIAGKWNRTFAVLGVAWGGWLVYNHWSGVSGFFAGP